MLTSKELRDLVKSSIVDLDTSSLVGTYFMYWTPIVTKRGNRLIKEGNFYGTFNFNTELESNVDELIESGIPRREAIELIARGLDGTVQNDIT